MNFERVFHRVISNLHNFLPLSVANAFYFIIHHKLLSVIFSISYQNFLIKAHSPLAFNIRGRKSKTFHALFSTNIHTHIFQRSSRFLSTPSKIYLFFLQPPNSKKFSFPSFLSHSLSPTYSISSPHENINLLHVYFWKTMCTLTQV